MAQSHPRSLRCLTVVILISLIVSLFPPVAASATARPGDPPALTDNHSSAPAMAPDPLAPRPVTVSAHALPSTDRIGPPEHPAESGFPASAAPIADDGTASDLRPVHPRSLRVGVTSHGVLQQAPVARLVIQVSPSPVFAGTPVLDVTVEAQDAAGQRVPGYRGTVTFNSTSAVEGLPRGGLRGTRYTFTAADAGQHQWSGVTLNTAGDHTITVQDGTWQATSDPITVLPIQLQIAVDPVTVFAGTPVLDVMVEAQDAAGQRVPGYLGSVSI